MICHRKSRVVVFALVLVALAVSPAAAALEWRRGKCEPPSLFYGATHEDGAEPCCPLVEGLCPKGAECGDSTCTEKFADVNVQCTKTASDRKNVVLFLTDDQGSCHYGAAGECYSNDSGTPIPAPLTPALDALAASGTTFPIAHNASHWCLPSLAAMVTGRYQRSFADGHEDDFANFPRALRSLGTWDGTLGTTKPDWYDNTAVGGDGINVIGGYCTFFAGKFAPPDHDAKSKVKSTGRITCKPDGSGAPSCASELTGLDQTKNIGDLFEFIDSMVYEVDGETRAQRFFAWYHPHLPHEKLPPKNGEIVNYLFGPAPSWCGIGVPFPLGTWCGSSCTSCTLRDAFLEDEKGGVQAQDYGAIWWVDRNLAEIRSHLAQTPLGPTSSPTKTLADETVIIHVSDNGWFMPRSKKNFTENGYRTRIIVYDPSQAPAAPAGPDVRVSNQLVHSNDILPTVMHYALDKPNTTSVACPAGRGGTGACDGLDLVPHLLDAAGAPETTTALRSAMCGHNTRKPRTPDRERYILTSAYQTGRCYRVASEGTPPAGSQLGAEESAYAGHWIWDEGIETAAANETECTGREQCCLPGMDCDPGDPKGICLGKQCRLAPVCLVDEDCDAMFASEDEYHCLKPDDPVTARWCRNDPNKPCSNHDECDPCPDDAPACERVCAPRLLKFYTSGPKPLRTDVRVGITDLLIDPNETAATNKVGIILDREEDTVADDMSAILTSTMGRLACCIDAWWDAGGGGTSYCEGGCPVGLACE